MSSYSQSKQRDYTFVMDEFTPTQTPRNKNKNKIKIKKKDKDKYKKPGNKENKKNNHKPEKYGTKSNNDTRDNNGTKSSKANKKNNKYLSGGISGGGGAGGSSRGNFYNNEVEENINFNEEKNIFDVCKMVKSYMSKTCRQYGIKPADLYEELHYQLPENWIQGLRLIIRNSERHQLKKDYDLSQTDSSTPSSFREF